MAKIVSLIVAQMTADVKNAGTNDGFGFEVVGLPVSIKFRFPNLPSDERERGRVDVYSFNMRGQDVEAHQFAPGVEFIIRARGDDAWLPAAVHVFGMTENGETRRLGERRGSFDWISTDPEEGEQALTIGSFFGGATPI